MENLNEILLVACKNGEAEEVDELIQIGADVNCKGLFETPLLNAVRTGNSEIAQLLIKAGANVNDQSFGTTAMIDAILFGYQRQLVGKEILRNFKENYFDVLSLLLENGGDLMIKDAEGKNAVYHMVECGLVENLSELFMQKGELSDDELNNTMDYYYENKLLHRNSDIRRECLER